MNEGDIRHFLKKHPGLVWSSACPSQEAVISATLHSARLDPILDLSRHIAPDRLIQMWNRLCPPGNDQTPAQFQTSLILSGIYEVSREPSPGHASAA